MRLGKVCQLFGLTHSTIRNREKDGLIPPIPRGPSGDRLIPIEWVRDWIANGLPGPKPDSVRTPALPDVSPALGIETAVPFTTGAEVGIPETPAGVTPPELNIPDDEYRGDSMRVKRRQDDAAQLRAEKEVLVLERELEELKNPKAPAIGPGGDALSALINQNTQMMQTVLTLLAKPQGPDPIDIATRIIGVMKDASKPVDLSDRPEGKLYSAIMAKIVDRAGDRMFEADGDSAGGNGFLIEVAKVLAPIVGDIIRSRQAPVQPVRTSNGGTAPALPELTVAPSHGVESLAPDYVPGQPAANGSEGESVGFVDTVGDVFEVLFNLYSGGVVPDDAVQSLYQVIGSTPHPLVLRMMAAPVTALKIMAIGTGVSDAAAMIDTIEGREWVLKVQAGLADIYKGG
jgi:hypothetical protein